MYSALFPFKNSERVEDTVQALPEGSVWVDMGAGQARALAEGLRKNPKIAKGVAIAYKKPFNAIKDPSGTSVLRRILSRVFEPQREFVPTKAADRFSYLHGDYVENMYRDGKLDDLKGNVDLITDVFGPVSYSENLPDVLQTYFDLLKQNGVLIVNLMLDVNYSGHGANFKQIPAQAKNQVFTDRTIDRNGVITWLKTIPGIEVIDESEVQGNGIARERSAGIKIVKTAEDVIVPRTLKTEVYEAGSPPKRIFRLLEDQAASGM
jgi:hypothetical protein